MSIKTTVTLPEPDEHADLTLSGGEVNVPVWHLTGSIFEDLGEWVRAASSVAPMEIAGHDVGAGDLDVMEYDLLALLAAIRASRAFASAPAVTAPRSSPGVERLSAPTTAALSPDAYRPYKAHWHHVDERGGRGCASESTRPNR